MHDFLLYNQNDFDSCFLRGRSHLKDLHRPFNFKCIETARARAAFTTSSPNNTRIDLNPGRIQHRIDIKKAMNIRKYAMGLDFRVKRF